MFNHLNSRVGRLLIGYLLFRSISWTMSLVGAAPTDNGTNSTCSPDQIQSLVDQGKFKSDPNGAAVVFHHCSAEFLEQHAVPQVVKQTVDQWLGDELDKADEEQLFILYQLALMGGKPDEMSSEFKQQCEQMLQDYDQFRDATSPLASQIGQGQLLRSMVSELDRNLLNFAQYAQFCKSFIQQQEV